MRLRLSSAAAALALLAMPAMPASAQSPHPGPGPDAVARDVVRDVVRRATAHLYQGRNNEPEQTERFSRKIRIGRDGRVSLQNIAGDIVVTGGSGDDVSIEAVKRTRGGRGDLSSVHIDVDERSGRVDVRTTHTSRNDRTSVDYTITVPASAGVELKSISGDIKVSNVDGAVRADTVSGDVTTADTPQLENARSVSGNISLTGAAADGDLSAGSVSGNVTAKGVKARGLDLGSVSGDVIVSDVTCDRLGVKSVSGNVEYSGAIVKNGRYEITSHSGSVRLRLDNPAGFELNANSFSGSIRSDLPLTIGGEPGNRGSGSRRNAAGNHTIHATYGDGSATVTLRTFSGNIVISKR